MQRQYRKWDQEATVRTPLPLSDKVRQQLVYALAAGQSVVVGESTISVQYHIHAAPLRVSIQSCSRLLIRLGLQIVRTNNQGKSQSANPSLLVSWLITDGPERTLAILR
jgi:hypothetical protein